MTYNPNNSKERKTLDPDIITEGILTILLVGKIGEIIGTERWKGGGSDAIKVEIEGTYNGNTYNTSKVMGFIDEFGKTLYTKNSNLAKYKQKYGKLPEIGDRVKCKTNKEGYFRLLLD